MTRSDRSCLADSLEMLVEQSFVPRFLGMSICFILVTYVFVSFCLLVETTNRISLLYTKYRLRERWYLIHVKLSVVDLSVSTF